MTDDDMLSPLEAYAMFLDMAERRPMDRINAPVDTAPAELERERGREK